MRVALQSSLQLAVETLDEAIALWTVGSCPSPAGAEQGQQVAEKRGLKLGATICGDNRSSDGTPKRAIHPAMKAVATVSAAASLIGMASGQRVKRSTQVSR
eukprot:scpid23773/ scgid19618/ 